MTMDEEQDSAMVHGRNRLRLVQELAIAQKDILLSTTTRFISVAALTNSAGSVAQQVEERASAAFMPCLSIQVEQIFSVTSLTGYDNLINDQI